MKRLCTACGSHDIWDRTVFLDDDGKVCTVYECKREVTSVICYSCKQEQSLGPSDETDAHVAIEIRAAELAGDFHEGVGLGGHHPDHCDGEHCWHWFAQPGENDGPCCYCGHDGIVLPGIENSCQAGHLARAIATHETESQ